MCGICGGVGIDASLEVVKRMAQAMIHRGPDSDGFFDGGRIALGMRRLRIIDLATGDQPIYNEDRTIAIVFNGEIYNFTALHRELEVLGHTFVTHSDTEAIVHAYEQWGTDCPRHLRGMFAFAIVDQRLPEPPRLFIARDRLGIKPLYVWQGEGCLLFASELRALLAGGRVPKRLSPAGLYTYLAFGSVQEPLTLIEDIYSLAPGTWLQCDCQPDGLAITRQRYWSPPIGGDTEPDTAQVREWLSDAVSSHLISDVPLGAFLSGGLDSSSIVALGSQAQDRPMRTFTIGFDNWLNDERVLAGLTVQRWQTDHAVHVVSQAELLDDLPQAIAAMDQPTVDGVNSWYVSREAKRAGLTVALSGVGGDELFAGYPSFRQVPRLKRLPRVAWLARPVSRFWPGSADSRRKLAAFMAGQMPLAHPYFAQRGLFTGGQIRALLQPTIREQLDHRDQALMMWKTAVEAEVTNAAHYDSIGEVSWLELSQYMRSTLLRDTDMMSMAHSLEVRVPFVDHLLVEHVLPIRGQHKLDRDQPKPLLVKALARMLPDEVVTGAKRTFTFPFETWLRSGLSQTVGERLTHAPERLTVWLDPDAAAGVWRDFETGCTNWARPWALYIFEAWVKQNL